jgi:large subunit ribosomal protein L2
MGIKAFKPTSAARRFYTVSDFKEITKGTQPPKALTEHQTSTGGRNNNGRITSRFRGGGHKQRYRLIDWKRKKVGVDAVVATVEYDPNRTARIALIHYADGEKLYILAPDGLKVGDKIITSKSADIKPGNAMMLRYIPLGTMIHNVEMKKGKGAQLVRSAGAGAVLMAKDGDYAQVRLPSGEVDRPSVEHRPPEYFARQSRTNALARSSSAQPRRHDEPGRPSDGRWRGTFFRWSSSMLAMGTAVEGPQNAQQQAH